MASAVDTSYLSAYTSVPEPTIQSLLSDPTPAIVTSFLRNIIDKAQDHEKVRSDRLRLEVELENAVRGTDLKDRGQKARADTAVKEAQDLRSKLAEEEKAKTALQSQLESVQTTSISSSSEVQALQSQIARVEKAHRDSISLLESKSAAHDRLSQELTAQHQKFVDSRRQISGLEERKQHLENELSAAKFKESRLQTEVEQVKRSNQWFESELQTKNAEHTKFRKEKNARIAELQRANEDATQSIDSLARTESALRKRLEEKDEKLDESFLKIQQLQEEAARQEENFRVEKDSSQRLAQLQQERADTARARVQELEDEKSQLKDDASEEIANVQSELESERQERETAERRIEQLESDVERLESELQISRNADGASTPHRRHGARSIPSTPGQTGTPTPFSPDPTRARAGISFTQLFSQYNTLKSDLEQEQRAHSSLRQTFDEMLRELQEKEPELQQTQEERDHYEAETNQLSNLLETARQEKDTARKDCRKLQNHAESCERKARNLEQQLRDLSVQIKTLVVEVQIREQGGQLDAAQREQLHRAARGELDVEAVEGMSDTAQFISKHLISFKDVYELQEKNMQLTKIVRELGESREAEEAREKQDVQRKEHAELEDLRERVERYKDEVKSLVTQSQSYIRERDMFRRMLTHRGQLPPDADLESMFGTSVNGNGVPMTPQPGRSTMGADQSAISKDLADHVELLKELQSHFDTYRQETATDYHAAKAQIEQLNKEKNHLQGDVIKASSQLALAQERYQMLQSNYELLRNEHSEIQKRSNTLHEAAARQDIRTQQVAEDLVEAQSLSEGLRNENANLKAEREMWRRIETRLGEDNRSLIEERVRLNKLLTDTQSLANEREMSDSESKRRMEIQVEALGAELQSVRRKLEEETDSSKSAALRREYEQEQNRTRIDDLVKSLGNVKEELVAAKSTRDQLQSRVEEMKIELRSAEERTQALQPRPTSKTPTPSAQTNGTSEVDGLSREQQLSMEIVDLKRELDLSKADLENVRAQVEQYRAISQSAEEELNNINQAHDQYREDTDKITTEKDFKIKDLEQRLEDTATELTATNDQLSELRASTADSSARLDQQRAAFEGEIVLIKDECERYKETADFYQQDLKAQAEVAQQAQQNYDNELVKHAEAAKSLKKVRDELNETKLAISTSKADAEAARILLLQNQDTWNSTREQYEKEIAEMKTRRDDVDAQNKLLHAQLESVSAQITTLQQRHSTSSADGQAQAQAIDTDAGLQNLQEVIKYLRREKEIVDVQYELSTQETRRLKQQLDYAQTQMDEARLRLDQERQKQSDREAGASSHKQLMDTLNELNVFRESSVTLRNEARQAQRQVAENAKQIEDLLAQIQPLQTSLREREGECEKYQGEIKLLTEARDGLQQRIHNILQKYDRVDPAVIEGLKEQILKTEGERDEYSVTAKTLQETAKSLQEIIDNHPNEVREGQEAARKELRDRLQIQFKDRSKQLSGQINTTKAEAQTLRTQLESVQAELELTRTARDEAIAKLETTEQSITPTTTEKTAQKAQDGGEEGQMDEGEINEESTSTPPTKDLEARATAAESQVAARSSELKSVRAEAESLREKIKDLEGRVTELESMLERSKQEQSSIQDVDMTSDENSRLAKVKQDLAAAQSEIEILRSGASSNTTQQSTGSADVPDAEQLERITQTVRMELETASNERIKQAENDAQERVQGLKKQLQTKLMEGKAAFREQLRKEQEENFKKLEQELDEARKSSQTVGPSTPAPTTSIPSSDPTTAPAGTENAFNEDSTVAVKVESAKPPDQWTAVQVQTFIQSNQFVKGIVSRNIKARIDQETAKLKENTERAIAERLQAERSTAEKDFNEKLEEARQKAETAKVNAVAMEGKRISVKMSMADNKVRAANAKLEVVEKASIETPQKAVVEVWTIAKATKAPAAPPAVQTSVTSAPNTHSPKTTAPASSPARPSAAQLPIPQTTQPTLAAVHPPKGEAPQLIPEGQSAAQINGKPAPEGATSSQTQTHSSQPSVGTGPAAIRGLAAQTSAIPQSSGIPRGGATIRGGATRGRGGASNTPSDANQQSGQQANQSGLPRGGGRGAGRGGRGAQVQGTPGRGGPNAGGRQFVPNKRPREDSTGDLGNKRPRGGQGQV